MKLLAITIANHGTPTKNGGEKILKLNYFSEAEIKNVSQQLYISRSNRRIT